MNKRCRRPPGSSVGGMVDLAVEPDLDERETGLQRSFETLFKEKKLAKWYAN